MVAVKTQFSELQISLSLSKDCYELKFNPATTIIKGFTCRGFNVYNFYNFVDQIRTVILPYLQSHSLDYEKIVLKCNGLPECKREILQTLFKETISDILIIT